VTVLAVAHRAGNSLSALRTAAELGADVLEADVHAFRGRLELRHSKSLGPLPWLWDKWELTSTCVPQLQLRELIAGLDGRSMLMLDLKGPGGVGVQVAETLHQRLPDQPVLVCSRWWPGVDAFAGRPWARPLLTARNRGELQRLRRRVRGARSPYGVSVHRSLLTAALVAELHERVELVLTWPVNDPAALDEVLARGVTGVISDEADILRTVLACR
jgi:glycerophosphoryl diester phosphodiesterase